MPSKMMIRAADVLAEARRVPALAGASTVSPDFTPVAARIRAEATDRLDDKPRRPVHLWGGRFICGRARIVARRTISVDGVEFIAHRALVLNSGTEPAIPPIPGLAETPFWSNRETVAVTAAPALLVVIGGGAIDLELAQAFARLGSTVTVVEASQALLPMEEPEVGALIADVLTRAQPVAGGHAGHRACRGASRSTSSHQHR